MQRIAKFEKVSFEQFKKDWQGEHPQLSLIHISEPTRP